MTTPEQSVREQLKRTIINKYAEIHVTARDIVWGKDNIPRGARLSMIPLVYLSDILALLDQISAERERAAYRRGYQAGHAVNGRSRTNKDKDPDVEIIGYGLTRGQIAVIKMQVERFGTPYAFLARHYKVTKNAIYQIVETKQFADISPLAVLRQPTGEDSHE